MFGFHFLPGKRRSAFLGQYLSDIGMDTLSVDGVYWYLHRLWVRVKERQLQKSQRNQRQAQKSNEQPSAGLTMPLSDDSPHVIRPQNPLCTSAVWNKRRALPHAADDTFSFSLLSCWSAAGFRLVGFSATNRSEAGLVRGRHCTSTRLKPAL